MLKSDFNSDLEKEQKLFPLLDAMYSKKLKYYSFKRISDYREQLKGVDVIFKHTTTHQDYYIDEKAQLDYINEDLPTFAFEISYLKKGKLKQGWLFNSKKKTDFYSLVTSIYQDEPRVFTSCKITLVNRSKLIAFLNNKGVSEEMLTQNYNEENLSHGKTAIEELDPKNEGYLFFSKNNKAEKPINLILRLDFLIQNGAAKRLA